MAKGTRTERIKDAVKDLKKIRNIGIAAHIDHGKTTLTDNLLAGAGMLSEELAGTAVRMVPHMVAGRPPRFGLP